MYKRQTNNGVGKLTLNNNLALSSDSTLVADINGTTAGSDYDQVAVTGSVAFTSAALTVNLVNAYTPALNDTFKLVDNDSASAITGTFDGVAESSRIGTLQASYLGGTGNDFTLTMNNTCLLYTSRCV